MPKRKETRGRQGLGSVYFEKGTGRYVAQVLTGYKVVKDAEGREVGRPQYRKARRPSETEAIDALKEMLKDQALGRVIPTERRSLGDWLDEWLRDVIKPNKEPKTYAYYDMFVRLYIKTTLGIARRDLRKVDAASIAAVLSYWQTHKRSRDGKILDGGSSSYNILRGIRNTLRSALTTATRYGLIHENPASRTDPPKQGTKSTRFLTRVEAGKLLAELHGNPVENLVRFGMATGMRIGEAIGLTWAQVDLIRRDVHVAEQLQRVGKAHTLKSLKSESARRGLPLTDDAFAAIRAEEDRQAAIQARREKKGKTFENPLNLVFLNKWGRAWHMRSIGRHLADACGRAEIPLVTFHTLRHSAATFMLMDGVPLHTVSKWLGHSSVGLTSQLYGHVLTDSLREAAKTLERAYLPTNPLSAAKQEDSPKDAD